MMKKPLAIWFFLSCFSFGPSLALSIPPIFSTATASPAVEATAPTETNAVATKVAVAGATGRTGRYVVELLLEQNVSVVAMVRSAEKAKEIFSDPLPEGLEVIPCDLTNEDKIQNGERKREKPALL